MLTGKRGKTPPDEELVGYTQGTFPERPMQHQFRIWEHLAAALLFALIVHIASGSLRVPDRVELGPRAAMLTFKPVRLGAAWGPFRLAGAWRVTSSDPRLGGVSALGIDGADLVAISDVGSVIRFPKRFGPQTHASIREVPGGPRTGAYKIERDSESLARDPWRRGWWVAFEHGNQLWLFDRGFERPLERIDFGYRRWPPNDGLEGVLGDGSGLLMFPESGREVVRLENGQVRIARITNPQGRISDAARLPDGRLLLIQRSFTWGFRSALVELRKSGEHYRLERRVPLPLGRLDNPEGLAAERLPDGTTRLWLMTDDNFQRPLRTLLVALDIPAS
jgi:hypothetical protein